MFQVVGAGKRARPEEPAGGWIQADEEQQHSCVLTVCWEHI